MSEHAKRLLEQALNTPEFMTQVRQAVLESPIVQAKDAEIATLRSEVSRLEAEVGRLTRERDGGEHGLLARLREAEGWWKRDLSRAQAAEAALENTLQLADGLTHRVDAAESQRDRAVGALRTLVATVRGYKVEFFCHDGLEAAMRGVEALLSPPAPEEKPTGEGTLHFCNKCGYSGARSEHPGCNYLAYTVPAPTDV